MSVDVASRLHNVRDRIRAAAERAGRDPGGILLIAVTKGVEPARIPSGVFSDLGENRVAEFERKHDSIEGVRWHFIGTLQRNKAARVVGRVELIHSVDTLALGEAVARAARARALVQDVLVQVNTSGEPTKHGVEPARAVEVAGTVAALEGVRVRGFMTMAPPDDAQASKECFAELRSIRDVARRTIPGATELSMGMSGDFEVAVHQGATMLRIGTEIFGPRAG